jgi:hypothetical protein
VFKGYEYDWKYILNKWIDNHKSATGFKKRSKFLFSSLTSSESKRKKSKSSFYATTLDGEKYS